MCISNLKSSHRRFVCVWVYAIERVCVRVCVFESEFVAQSRDSAGMSVYMCVWVC